MVKRKRRIFRILGWIVVGFVSFILLITLIFYLGRGWIMGRAVSYLNENQPGEVQMGSMNLIPFMKFPDVSLQLRNVSFYEKKVHPDSLYMAPILNLSEIYVILDVVDLIKGRVEVEEARFRDGFIRLEMYEDSVLNLEKALGIDFGSQGSTDTPSTMPDMHVNLEQLVLSNILLLMDDHLRGDRINATMNRLETSFRYLPEHVEVGLEVEMAINDLNYLTYRSLGRREIELNSHVVFDPVNKSVAVDPSSISISGLEFETWGSYNFQGEPYVDLAFRASNKGLEVLNYLFRGVLDLDEIEQIGSGSIYLSGNVTGPITEQLPVLRLNGMADQIGFRIKSLQKDVTDISFKLYATNGEKADFSEGIIQFEGFTASFPEGYISGSLSAHNIVSPELDIELKGDVDLKGLEKMLKTNIISDLEGKVRLDGNLQGVIDRNSGEFLNDAGTLRAHLENVGFAFRQDSGIVDSVKHMHGAFYMKDEALGTRDLQLEFNGNNIGLTVETTNLLHYLMGFERDVAARLSMQSEVLSPASVFHDTAVSGLLGEELRGLHFSVGAKISSEDLDRFIKNDSIPVVEILLDSFGIELPVYSDISNMNASLTIGPDSFLLHHLNGTVGESEFRFSGMASNYGALLGSDSTGVIGIRYDVSSDLMRAEDFFIWDGEFLLPETYRTEYLEEFHIAGEMEILAEGILHDSVSMDFGLNIQNLGWNFRYYPLSFEKFFIQLRRQGDNLFVDNFEGKVGESNLKMKATIGNFTDTIVENLYGNLVLESDLLDFNELLNYQLPEELADTTHIDTFQKEAPPRLDQIEYPRFDFTVDIEELRYGSYKIFGMDGKLRSSKEKIFYLDRLVTSAENGGKLEFNGQFNVSSPYYYAFSATVDLENVDINDLDFEMQMGEETYTLKENFRGLVSAEGMAEIFITPDLKVDIPNTTATFNLQLADGAIINFTPLQAAAKYLDNKDLNYVRFATLNNYNFTLVDSRIYIPLMNVESTIGQLLIEGEQGLDGEYLYLIRVPTWLVRGAVGSRLSGSDKEEEEDQIQEMQLGKFLVLTAWGDGEESEVRVRDQRDRYQ